LHSAGVITEIHDFCIDPDSKASEGVLLKMLAAVTDGCSIAGLDNFLRETVGVDLTVLNHAEGGLIYILDASKFLSGVGEELVKLFWPIVLVALFQAQVLSIVGRSVGAAVVHGCNQWLEAANDVSATNATHSPLELDTATVQLDFAFEIQGGPEAPQCGKVFASRDFAKICEHALEGAEKAAVLPPFVTVSCAVDCVADVVGLVQPTLFVSTKLTFVDVVPAGVLHGLEESAKALAVQLAAAAEPAIPSAGLEGTLFRTKSSLVGQPAALGREWVHSKLSDPAWAAATKSVTVEAIFPEMGGLHQQYCEASPAKCQTQPPPPPPQPLPPRNGSKGWIAWKTGALAAGACITLALGVVVGYRYANRAHVRQGAGGQLAAPLFPASGAHLSPYEDDEIVDRDPHKRDLEV
jgi:hypothetical protein